MARRSQTVGPGVSPAARRFTSPPKQRLFPVEQVPEPITEDFSESALFGSILRDLMRSEDNAGNGLEKNIVLAKVTYALALSQGAEPTGEAGRASPKRTRPASTANGLAGRGGAPGGGAGGGGGSGGPGAGMHRAATFFRKDAFHGDAHAQYSMGECCMVGDGHSANEVAARGWFEKAAAQGHTLSARRLGTMLIWGKGGARDHAKGFQLWQRAAAEGDEGAEENIALFEQALDAAAFS